MAGSVSAVMIKRQRKWLRGTAPGRDWADTVTHREEVKCTSTLGGSALACECCRCDADVSLCTSTSEKKAHKSSYRTENLARSQL